LTAVDEGGYRALLRANVGNVTVVDFWATWCAPCRKEMPLLAKLEERLRDKSFRLLTISADDPEQETAAITFLQSSGFYGPAYIRRAKDDDAFIKSVDPKWSGALPALFLYDKTGKIAKSFTGETDIAALESTLRKLL
jgi:thiol-disulfide isomerase/thioredoxin